MAGAIPGRYVLGTSWDLDEQRAQVLLGKHSGGDRNDPDEGNLYHSPFRFPLRCHWASCLEQSFPLKLGTGARESQITGWTYSGRGGNRPCTYRLLLLRKFPALGRISGPVQNLSTLDKDGNGS